MKLPHFKGMRVNNNSSYPSKQNGPSYMGTVSQEWATITNNLDMLMAPNSLNFLIFSFDIGDMSLDRKALTYFADDEMETTA